MANIRKRGSKYQVQIFKTINGNIVRESNTFLTKSEAQAWATIREAELMESDRKGIIVGNKHTLYDALTKYLEEVTPTKRGFRRETLAINRFIREIDFVGELLSNIKPAHFARLRDERLKIVKGSTINREFSIISAIYTKAINEWGWCSVNPLRAIDKPKNSNHRKRLISENEIEIILKELNYIDGIPPKNNKQEIAYAFLIAIETAMRKGEILSLAYENVFLERRFVHLDKTKNGDARDVPLSSKAINLFEQLFKNNNASGKVFKLSSTRAEVLFWETKQKANLHDLNFHDTRHEAITRLSKKLGVLELARMVGHRNISQLMTYYNETAESLASKLG